MDKNDLTAHIMDHFINLFTTENFQSNKKDQWGTLNLVKMPSMWEFKKVVFSMGTSKSPGINGFHPMFFQKH